MPRVSDERLAEYAEGGMVPSQDLALDLRDARAECAKWRECTEALAEDMSALAMALGSEVTRQNARASIGELEAVARASLVRTINAMKNDMFRGGVSAANAALLALQRRIDRAREALALGNTDRARRILEGED